jgi:hypothetical protein
MDTSREVTATFVHSAGDTAPPTTPTGLTATASSSSQINLSWTASTDNVGVTGYKIYRVGAASNPIKSVTTTTASDTGLSANTEYCYTVSAYDAAGNESAHSDQKCATTNSGVVNVAAAVVGAWSGSATCYGKAYRFDWIICPAGRLRGAEKLAGYDFIDCGTWTVSGNRMTGSYKYTAVIDSSVTGNDTQAFDYNSSTDKLKWALTSGQSVGSCELYLTRAVGSVNEADCTTGTCTAGGTGSITCGTDCDCGHCWYCENNTCRYGGEGPYGCYRGCPF